MPVITTSIVKDYLAPLLPMKSKAINNVAAWVEQKGFRFCNLDAFNQNELLSLSRDQKDEIGETIYDAYCSARGIERVHKPSNLSRAADFIAQEKFHYENSNLLEQASPYLDNQIWGGLSQYEWRGQYLVRQHLDDKDLQYAARSWFKAWQDKWSKKNWENYNKRQEACMALQMREYTKEELFEAVQALLQENKTKEYTYNQVADALRIDKKKVAQVMAVKDSLERLSQAGQNIYNDIIKYSTRPTNGKKSATVYKWAPLRRQLDANPRMRGELIRTAIYDFVEVNPDCSARAIREHCRSTFGQIDNKSVDTELQSLIAGGRIEKPAIGPHRAHLHRVAVVQQVSSQDATLPANEETSISALDQAWIDDDDLTYDPVLGFQFKPHLLHNSSALVVRW